jgi:uncharacterized protein YbcI
MQTDSAFPLTELPEPTPERGPLLATISNTIVGLYKQYYGKGPTKARSYYLDDIIVCVLRGGLTRAEITLARSGRIDAVLRQRQEFRAAVHDKFVEAIQEVVGRPVTAFMSATNADPDVNIEIFMLERDPEDA